MTTLFEARDVGLDFHIGGATTIAVKAMSFAFSSDAPRIVTLAGESGCGKSTLALMALGFLRPTRGSILYGGTDILTLDRGAFKEFRRRVQAVFQNPFESFNPVFRVDRMLECAVAQAGLSRRDPAARRRIVEALARVQLDPELVLGRYPHQLSGGQLQRISIARAILLEPRVLVADEPVSMVDASVRLLILRQLVDLRDSLGVSILYITHDLSTALQISDDLLIARAGEIVERGDPRRIFSAPQHDYTRLLIGSIPRPDPDARWTQEVQPAIACDSDFG